MDDRVDIIITRTEKSETKKLAKDVPHESDIASRVLDHELEEPAFKAKRPTDDRVKEHTGERDAPDEEAWNPICIQGDKDVYATRVIAAIIVAVGVFVCKDLNPWNRCVQKEDCCKRGVTGSAGV